MPTDYGQWHSHWGGKGSRVPPLTAKKCQKSGKNQEKSVKISGKIRGKSGRKGKNLENCFHFARPDRWGWLRYCPWTSNLMRITLFTIILITCRYENQFLSLKHIVNAAVSVEFISHKPRRNQGPLHYKISFLIQNLSCMYVL